MTSVALAAQAGDGGRSLPDQHVGSVWFLPSNSTDTELIELLRQSDSDLCKPHPIEFSMASFPNLAGARQVAAWLAANGFSVSLHCDEEQSRSYVFATKYMVPCEIELREIGSYLTHLAAAEGGEYEGWSAAVVPFERERTRISWME